MEGGEGGGGWGVAEIEQIATTERRFLARLPATAFPPACPLPVAAIRRAGAVVVGEYRDGPWRNRAAGDQAGSSDRQLGAVTQPGDPEG